MVEIRTELHEEVDRLIDSGKMAMDSGSIEDAHRLFREAYEKNPNDPHAMSYYGYTISQVEDKAHRGLELCQQAIKTSVIDPHFFLNIAMIYIKLGRKREAVGAFKKGLQIDRSNKKIHETWKNTLGIRRKPAIGFLDRSNPINKFLGKSSWKRLQKKGKI